MYTISPQDVAAIACGEDTRPAILTTWTGKCFHWKLNFMKDQQYLLLLFPKFFLRCHPIHQLPERSRR